MLVNNAGFSTLGPVAKSDPDDEMMMVEVDVVAVVDLCSRFLPGMVERDRGAILNVASHGGVPAPARPGGVRRRQGVRAVVHAEPGR